MKKPDWADEFHEATYDYGWQKGWSARVGPLSHAVRVLCRRVVEDEVTVTLPWAMWFKRSRGSISLCWGPREVTIKEAVTEPFEPDEAEVHAALHDWFKDRVRVSREYLAAAKRRGLW